MTHKKAPRKRLYVDSLGVFFEGNLSVRKGAQGVSKLFEDADAKK